METKVKKSSFATLMLSLFTSSFIVNSTFLNLGIRDAYASSSMVPSDGDFWTENNNATYTWKLTYKPNLLSFTSIAKVGSYALNATHTHPVERTLYFTLTLNASIDVSSYEGIFFWLRATYDRSRDEARMIYLYINDGTSYDGSNKFQVEGFKNPPNGTWVRYYVPLSYFEKVGIVSWLSIRFFYFMFYLNTPSTHTEILIDGLRFTTLAVNDVPGETIDDSDFRLLPNLWWFTNSHEYHPTGHPELTFPITGTNQTDGDNSTFWVLYAEVAEQYTFALLEAYRITGYDFYLGKAKKYAEMIIQFQHSTFGGVLGTDQNGKLGNSMGVSQDSWGLASVSYLYYLTHDTKYLQSAYLLKRFFIDVMWNSTTQLFDYQITSGGVKTYCAQYDPMIHGPIPLGLSYYYHYIKQNSTVLNIISVTNSKAWNQGTRKHHGWLGNLEFGGYALWGFYGAWKFTNNNTVGDQFKELLTYLKIRTFQAPENVRGSMLHAQYRVGIWTADNWLDNWGWAVTLPLLVLAYKDTQDILLKNVIDKALWFYWSNNASLLSMYPRYKRWTKEINLYLGVWKHISYNPTAAFLMLSIELYMKNILHNEYYLTYATNKIISIIRETNKLTFTIDAPTGIISTTEAYVGGKGKPTSVSGAYSWSYDETTKIVTVTVMHSSSREITLEWTIPASVSFYPDTLNLKSKGGRINSYVELPEGYSLGDIDISSIRINDTIVVDPTASTKIGDHDSDGIPDLMVKFDKVIVAEWMVSLGYGGARRKQEVTFRITGRVNDALFEGFNTVMIRS